MQCSFRQVSLAVMGGVSVASAVLIAAVVTSREVEPSRPEGALPVIVASAQLLIPAPERPDGMTAPCLAFSPDGRDMAAGWLESGSLIVSLRDAESGRERWRIEPSVKESPYVAFTPDGLSIPVGPSQGDASGLIKLYDVRDGEERSTLKSRALLPFHQHLEFSPDGRYAAATRWNRILVLDVAKPYRNWEGELASRELLGVAFSLDGRYVAAAGDGPMYCRPLGLFGLSGYGCGVKGGAVGLWDVATKTRLLDLKPSGRAHAVAFSPDGSTLASGGWDGLRLWSLPRGQGRWVVSGRVERLAYSSDGRWLALLLQKGLNEETTGEVWIWDVTAERVRTILRGAPGRLRALAFSPDGRKVVAAGVEGVVRWDLAFPDDHSVGSVRGTPFSS